MSKFNKLSSRSACFIQKKYVCDMKHSRTSERVGHLLQVEVNLSLKFCEKYFKKNFQLKQRQFQKRFFIFEQ